MEFRNRIPNSMFIIGRLLNFHDEKRKENLQNHLSYHSNFMKISSFEKLLHYINNALDMEKSAIIYMCITTSIFKKSIILRPRVYRKIG